MPRAKGTANYKVDVLIQVVEELLPNGAQGWQEAAFLYQHQKRAGMKIRAQWYFNLYDLGSKFITYIVYFFNPRLWSSK
jgi:hypothetical protein